MPLAQEANIPNGHAALVRVRRARGGAVAGLSNTFDLPPVSRVTLSFSGVAWALSSQRVDRHPCRFADDGQCAGLSGQ